MTIEFDEFPDGWQDSCLVSSLKRNRDGSITVNIQIDIDDDEGGHWETFRIIRLKKWEYKQEAK